MIHKKRDTSQLKVKSQRKSENFEWGKKKVTYNVEDILNKINS